MTIQDVKIDNWQHPGDVWWNQVEERPAEPLIEATIKLTLSWDEYQALLTENKRAEGCVAPGQEIEVNIQAV